MKLTELNFINCLGTYAMSICDEYSNKVFLLEYLEPCAVEYVDLNLRNIQKEFNNNPWGYQLIKIKDMESNELFTSASFKRFICYLEKTFKIKRIDFTEGVDVWTVLNKEHGTEIIIEIDEYYISHNVICYEKQHNPHAVLLKSISLEDETIEVLDTEYSNSYTITKKEIEQAFYSSSYKNAIYLFDCKTVQTVDKSICSNHTLRVPEENLRSIAKFFETIKNTNIINEDAEFVFKGYLFSVLYKIMPYFYMITAKSNMEQRKLIDSITYNIKRLSMIMMKKIFNNKYSFSDLQEFSDDIEKQIIYLISIVNKV